jgi:acyl-CoA thioester hydrolase
VNYHRVSLRIPFRDVDSWGLVWHGHYFAYVDLARIDLLRRFGILFGDFPMHGFVMPIVGLEMDLRSPGRADDPICIDVAILKAKTALAETHFRIVHEADESKVLARGVTRQVFMPLAGGLLYRIPEVVAEGFEAMHAFATGNEA